jgi:sugar lactone lactonase YvrE
MTPGGGKIFRLEGQELVPVIDNISCANGLAFSPDGRILYISDSPVARCDRWDVDPKTGAISNRKTLFELGPGEGLVDGATVDNQGGYWVTLVFASKLRRYLSDGTLDLEVTLPFESPTKVAFGGKTWDTLYITTTSETMGFPVSSPLNGGLFAYKPGVNGQADPLLPG